MDITILCSSKEHPIYPHIIEWANLIPQLLPEDISTIRFEHINLNERRIYLK